MSMDNRPSMRMERDAHNPLSLSPQQQVEPGFPAMESMNGSVGDHHGPVVKVEVKEEVKDEYFTDCTGNTWH